MPRGIPPSCVCGDCFKCCENRRIREWRAKRKALACGEPRSGPYYERLADAKYRLETGQSFASVAKEHGGAVARAAAEEIAGQPVSVARRSASPPRPDAVVPFPPASRWRSQMGAHIFKNDSRGRTNKIPYNC